MKIDFNKIKIELADDYFERADVSSVLTRCHPLGDKKEIGKRICYSASFDGVWLAVLVFDKAVDKNKHREAKIGWDLSQKKSRIKHVANNSRFCILPKFVNIPNLASKILSLVARRISNDWMNKYGIPLLALETYVDPDYNSNQGTCYTATGWEKLGLSSGYQISKEEKTHGKWYFLKFLHQRSKAALSSDIPHALTTGLEEVDGSSNNNFILDASKINLAALKKELSKLKDPRKNTGKKYDFIPFLTLCISAVLSGYTQYRQIADWIKNLPIAEKAKFGMPVDCDPHETTISKFLQKIDPIELNTILVNWLCSTYDPNNRIKNILIDGKALRATSKDPKKQKAFLNVFANEIGINIEQIPTKKGGGEKTAMHQFLDQNNFDGKTIVADAIHTDKNIINKLQKKTPHSYSLLKTIKRL